MLRGSTPSRMSCITSGIKPSVVWKCWSSLGEDSVEAISSGNVAVERANKAGAVNLVSHSCP